MPTTKSYDSRLCRDFMLTVGRRNALKNMVICYLSMFPEILDKVEEVMVKDPLTIDSGKLLVDAARMMEEKNIGSLIVVESGKCVGLVTERDFVRFGAAGIDMHLAPIKEHMTRPAISCQPSMKVIEAYLLMRKHKVGHLPVLKKDKTPVGMVTIRDLLTVGELRL